jgi:hypothetical protein
MPARVRILKKPASHCRDWSRLLCYSCSRLTSISGRSRVSGRMARWPGTSGRRRRSVQQFTYSPFRTRQISSVESSRSPDLNALTYTSSSCFSKWSAKSDRLVLTNQNMVRLSSDQSERRPSSWNHSPTCAVVHFLYICNGQTGTSGAQTSCSNVPLLGSTLFELTKSWTGLTYKGYPNAPVTYVPSSCETFSSSSVSRQREARAFENLHFSSRAYPEIVKDSENRLLSLFPVINHTNKAY